ncbi:phage tail assembly protein [Paenibacillus sp. NRS-1760]|uniref:phage tail assembly protein n=1 Tax=Paenibacillus sp. NRS-1760 TaxID=3233902 RepID=UPI003D26EE90
MVNDKKFVLHRSIDVDGEKITEFEINFEDLSADDILSADRQYSAENPGETSFVKEISKSYLAYIAARGVKQPVEVIRKLYAKDFTRITVLAQNFLLY